MRFHLLPNISFKNFSSGLVKKLLREEKQLINKEKFSSRNTQEKTILESSQRDIELMTFNGIPVVISKVIQLRSFESIYSLYPSWHFITLHIYVARHVFDVWTGVEHVLFPFNQSIHTHSSGVILRQRYKIAPAEEESLKTRFFEEDHHNSWIWAFLRCKKDKGTKQMVIETISTKLW